jgi:predicted XRE-type DNA-binding protein
MKKNKDYIVSSGNVFADLELPDAGELLAKAELTRQINALIKQKKLTLMAAADFLDIEQVEIVALSNGKIAMFSLEQLFKFLNKFDQKITIKVTPKTKSKKDTDVTVAIPVMRKVPMIKPATNHRSIQARKKSGKP